MHTHIPTTQHNMQIDGEEERDMSVCVDPTTPTTSPHIHIPMRVSSNHTHTHGQCGTTPHLHMGRIPTWKKKRGEQHTNTQHANINMCVVLISPSTSPHPRTLCPIPTHPHIPLLHFHPQKLHEFDVGQPFGGEEGKGKREAGKRRENGNSGKV